MYIHCGFHFCVGECNSIDVSHQAARYHKYLGDRLRLRLTPPAFSVSSPSSPFQSHPVNPVTQKMSRHCHLILLHLCRPLLSASEPPARCSSLYRFDGSLPLQPFRAPPVNMHCPTHVHAYHDHSQLAAPCLPDSGACCSQRLPPNNETTLSIADVIQTDDLAPVALPGKIELCVQLPYSRNVQAGKPSISTDGAVLSQYLGRFSHGSGSLKVAIQGNRGLVLDFLDTVQTIMQTNW